MNIDELQQELLARVAQSEHPNEVLRAPEFKDLYAAIREQAPEARASYGQRVNALKQTIEQAVADRKSALNPGDLVPIDVTAPMDVNRLPPYRDCTCAVSKSGRWPSSACKESTKA